MTLFITSVLALRYKAGVSLSTGRSSLSDSSLGDTTGDVVPVGQTRINLYHSLARRHEGERPGGNNSQSEYERTYVTLPNA